MIIGKNPCHKCRQRGEDRQGNNFHFYGEGKGGFCWKCGYTIPSDEYKSIEDRMGKFFDDKVYERIKKDTTPDGMGFRGIRTEISKPFGVRFEVVDGKVVSVYYPTTQDYEISGNKVRICPKDFSQPYGETGSNCELFGQFRFKTLASTIMIVGGEHDALAAYQMLSDSQKDKKFDPVAVVSSTVGESAAHKQVQKQYAFFNQFKKIIVCMDNDKAGKEAAEAVAKVLPRGKVYMMNMRRKDPNAYIYDNDTGRHVGAEQEFVNDFWQAKPYTPAGVYSSAELLNMAREQMDAKMISLPPCMKGVSAMSGGGIVRNEITLILAKTSIGKTTMMSALTQHMALNEQEEVVGVLSLEAKAGKFSLNMLSYHLKNPLHRMSKEDRDEYLQRPEVEEEVAKLYVKPDGSPTIYVCDDRGAAWGDIKEKILEMVIGMGVTVLIVDPYSDLLSGMTVSEQEEVATWFKKTMKEYDVTPIIVSHVRKSSNNGDGHLTEDDAQGSSFLVKASGLTIAAERDKMAEDEVERNRTYLYVLKNRDFSETGPAGSMYYDYKSANLYYFDDWAATQKREF